jgi:SAM-dependent methyltransferase
MPQDVLAGKIPNWQIDQLVHRRCPVCGQDTPKLVCIRPDQLIVGNCTNCQMLYLSDIPGTKELAELYSAYEAYKKYQKHKHSRLKKTAHWWTDAHIAILENTGGLSGRSICEIGCSFGHFLEIARKRKANVFGVELDQRALKHLEQIGIPASMDFDSTRSFDIVYASQLIEHLSSPQDMIAKIASALTEDGRLLLAMPNGDEAARVGALWIGYRVDLEHLNYFSIATLCSMLEQHDLYIEQFWESHQPSIPRHTTNIPIHGSLGKLRNKLEYFLVRLLNRPSLCEGSFVLTILARKVNTKTPKSS